MQKQSFNLLSPEFKFISINNKNSLLYIARKTCYFKLNHLNSISKNQK
jgi:hypothetical protein